MMLATLFLVGHVSIAPSTLCFPLDRMEVRGFELPPPYGRIVRALTLCIDTTWTGSGIYPGRMWGTNKHGRLVCEGFGVFDSVCNRIFFDACGVDTISPGHPGKEEPPF
jgi:hypothetical protein